MSEGKKKKTTKELQEEYSNGCGKAGEMRYKIFALEKDLNMILSSLLDLNLEYAASLQEEARLAEEAKKAEELAKTNEALTKGEEVK